MILMRNIGNVVASNHRNLGEDRWVIFQEWHALCSGNLRLGESMRTTDCSFVELPRLHRPNGAITSKIKHAIKLKQVLQDLHNCCSPH